MCDVDRLTAHIRDSEENPARFIRQLHVPHGGKTIKEVWVMGDGPCTEGDTGDCRALSLNTLDFPRGEQSPDGDGGTIVRQH